MLVDKVIDEYGKLFSATAQGNFLLDYCSGMPGFLLFNNYLKGIGEGFKISKNDLQVFNEMIAGYADKCMGLKNHDFLYGLAGSGLYFVENIKTKDAKKHLLKILSCLDQLKIVKDEKVYWQEYSGLVASDTSITYNLGMAHGMSSVLILLSKCLQAGIEPKNLRGNIEKCTDYILSHKFNTVEKKSFYPGAIKNGKPVRSRMGWCYGDLGVGLAFIACAKALHNKALYIEGKNILLNCAKRTDVDEGAVNDSMICHGAVGIALIFKKCYLEFKDEAFAVAMNYWKAKTLDFRDDSADHGGYYVVDYEGIKRNDRFLFGIAGVGAGLIDLENSHTLPYWYKLLFID